MAIVQRASGNHIVIQRPCLESPQVWLGPQHAAHSGMWASWAWRCDAVYSEASSPLRVSCHPHIRVQLRTTRQGSHAIRGSRRVLKHLAHGVPTQPELRAASHILIPPITQARRTRTYNSTVYTLPTFHQFAQNSVEGSGWFVFTVL